MLLPSVWNAIVLLAATLLSGVHGLVVPGAVSSHVVERDSVIPSCPWPILLPNYLKTITGGEQCLQHWADGHRIVGLTFWAGDAPALPQDSKHTRNRITQSIGRLEVRYDDGRKEVIGRMDVGNWDQLGAINVAPDELFTYLDISAMGEKVVTKGNALMSDVTQYVASKYQIGAIHFKTTRGQNMVINGAKEHPPPATTETTGGGILIGVTGYADANTVFGLNFWFTPGKVVSRKRHDMTFDPADLRAVATEIYEVTSGTDCNPGNNTSTYALANKNEVQTTLTTSKEHSYTVGLEISAEEKIEVPLLSSFTLTEKVSFSSQTSDMESVAHQNTQSATWRKTVTENPGQIMECVMQCGKATGPIPFQATMTLTFEDGSTHDYPEHGTLDGDIFTNNAISSCTPRSIDWNNVTDANLCGRHSRRFAEHVVRVE